MLRGLDEQKITFELRLTVLQKKHLSVPSLWQPPQPQHWLRHLAIAIARLVLVDEHSLSSVLSRPFLMQIMLRYVLDIHFDMCSCCFDSKLTQKEGSWIRTGCRRPTRLCARSQKRFGPIKFFCGRKKK